MRKLKLFSLALMALFATSVWGALTTKSDFANGDIFILSSSNIDAATWIEKGSSLTSTGNQTPQWMPVAGATSADVAGTANTFYKMKRVSDNKQLTLKVSGLTKITFYTHATSTGRVLRASVDGGTTTNLVSLTTSNVTYKGELPLTTGEHTIVIDLSNEGYVTALKVTAPAETYKVTIDPNGGAYASTPDGWTLTDGKYTKSGLSGSFNVPAGLTKDNMDLNGWKDGQGNNITLPITLSHDTTLVAQWAAHTESSDATLSALSVAGCTLSPAFAPATTAYTIALPFYASMPAVGDVTATKNDSYAKNPGVSISGNVITVACEAENGTTLNYTITVNIADAPTASSSINIEQLVLDNGKSYNIGSALTSANISYVDYNALDSLAIGDSNNSRPDYNEPFLGLKFKKATSKVTIIVPSGEALNVKFGPTDNLTVSVNGAAAAAPSLTNGVYSLAASEGAKEVVFALTGTKTVVFKQIMINEDIAVVRPFLATVAATTNGTASVELTKYAKGEEVTVNCTPAEGYELDGISVSGYTDKGAAMDVTVTDGKFTMPGSPVTITVTFKEATATAISNTATEIKTVKRLENGMLVIEKDGKTYNVMGQAIR